MGRNTYAERQDQTSIMTEITHPCGLSGTVVDGVRRNTAPLANQHTSAYGPDHWIRIGKRRLQTAFTNQPVNIDNISVAPG